MFFGPFDSFGAFLKVIRGIVHLTQKEMGEKLNVSSSSISSMEKYGSTGTMYQMMRFCDYLGVPTSLVTLQSETRTCNCWQQGKGYASYNILDERDSQEKDRQYTQELAESVCHAFQDEYNAHGKSHFLGRKNFVK